tara:strand:- start:231 stop:362 length:132 start_codon:yes stop_codon:yes gene_type:complete
VIKRRDINIMVGQRATQEQYLYAADASGERSSVGENCSLFRAT